MRDDWGGNRHRDEEGGGSERRGVERQGTEGTAGLGQGQGQGQEAKDRLYEERMEDEYAKREGGA